MRVRHYTRKSSKDKILVDETIEARDQNKVFVEPANADPYPLVMLRLATS